MLGEVGNEKGGFEDMDIQSLELLSGIVAQGNTNTIVDKGNSPDLSQGGKGGSERQMTVLKS